MIRLTRRPTHRWATTAAVAALAAGALFGCADAGEPNAPQDEGAALLGGRIEKTTRVDLSGWPDVSAEAAKMMVQKYGPPDGVTPDMLVWNNKGVWKQTIVSKQPVPHEFPKKHEDVLEQVINYRVPPDRFDELAQYDGSVIVERTNGTISARCDKEPMNYLALNLAHDIVIGRKSVDEAREFYARTAMAFMQGEKHAYTQKLQFDVPPGRTGDPDRPAEQR